MTSSDIGKRVRCRFEVYLLPLARILWLHVDLQDVCGT